MNVLKYSRPITTRNVYYRNFMIEFTSVQNKRMSTDIAQEPVLFSNVGKAGVITFNRPKKLNVADYETWKLLVPRLKTWEWSKSHIIMKGAGDKAFGCGGDIRWLLNSQRDPMKYAFVNAVSNGMYRLSKFRIPCIVFMNGITFGGAVTLAALGRYRVATERTLLATPEAGIGWLTDASGTYLLSRLDNHLGYYMALTGKRLKGKDAVASGLATHFVPSPRLGELERELCHCKLEHIESRLKAYSEPVQQFSLAAVMKDINYCFSADTVEEIIERLLKLDSPWSTETVQNLNQMCPTMLKVILRALKCGKVNSFKESLRTEYRIVYRCIGSYNAQEGLRAALIDKDNQPKWQPATLAEVTDAMVDSYFEPLPAGKELYFFDDNVIAKSN